MSRPGWNVRDHRGVGMRGGVTRVALWCCLALSCPGTAVATVLRPAFAAITAVAGFLACVVPASLLVRDRPPMHRCPPRHARHVDAEARLRLAEAERKLRGYEKFFMVLGLREAKARRWEPRVIDGDGDKEGDSGAEAGLTRPPLVLVG